MSLSKIIQNFIEQHKIDEEFFVEQNFKYLSQEDESKCRQKNVKTG